MKQYINQIFSLVFGLAVFTFFAFFYQYHLYYQEQYQLFLFTGDYFTQMSYHIGGLAAYLGSFLTQFFYYPKLGALIIAVLLVIIQELILFLSTMMKRQSYWTLLTFIPSIIYWNMLCDENTMMTGVAGLIITLLAASLYMLIENGWTRMVYLIVFAPLLYVMVGGVYVVFIFLSIIIEYFYFENASTSAIIGTVGGVLIAAFLPYVCSFFVQAPLNRLYWGFDWYRFPIVGVGFYLYIWVSVVLVPILFVVIPDMKKHAFFCTTAQFIGVVLLIVFALYNGYNRQKEEIMNYDFLIRSKQWDKVIQKAQKKSPNTPMSVADLNLALAKTGQMSDHMFDFFQRDPQGLLPDFQRDFTLPLVTSEIYYQLGFVNTAQRYAFEAMEATPDYQKSGRVLRRLAETNLINGEYKVAYKYLKILQKSLFYRKFANRTMGLLWNEKAINADPEYAWLRKCRPQKDFLFSEAEKDMMLGTLFVHNRKNRMAFEYLMAYYLLTGNLQQFAKCFPLGKSIGYDHVPYTYQQALKYLGRQMKQSK